MLQRGTALDGDGKRSKRYASDHGRQVPHGTVGACTTTATIPRHRRQVTTTVLAVRFSNLLVVFLVMVVSLLCQN